MPDLPAKHTRQDPWMLSFHPELPHAAAYFPTAEKMVKAIRSEGVCELMIACDVTGRPESAYFEDRDMQIEIRELQYFRPGDFRWVKRERDEPFSSLMEDLGFVLNNNDQYVTPDHESVT